MSDKKERKKMSDMFKLSFGEEVGNAVSHGALAIITLFLIPFSAVYTYINHGLQQSVAVSIYTICIFLMLIISAMYHSMLFNTKQKLVFRKLDHIAIYLAIAGSLTPVCFMYLDGWKLVLILALEWGATLGGILMKSISKYSYPILSVAIYLAMGWAAIFLLPAIWKDSSLLFMVFLVLGGIMYTIGVFFFSKKFPYAHFIWHLFIDLAVIFHYIGIVFLM